MDNIHMVDLQGQYLAIKEEIDQALAETLTSARFIKGPVVGKLECELADYLHGSYAVGVGNGTDALQVAMMALGIGPGDEVITTPFTFIATAEVAALLGAKVVFADIEPRTFNIDPLKVEALITPRTKAIVPVHLFGQPADMDSILDIAKRHNIAVIEDNAQAIGATYKGRPVGYIGDIGTLSFFPSKNLGCYGDGGAVLTNRADLHERMRMIANHGSRKKYYNEVVGINSRLDALQASILRVKLRHLDTYAQARQAAADRYDELFANEPLITTPYRDSNSTHVFHQYTLRISQNLPGGRHGLVTHLKAQGIPHAIYYPVSLHQLPVFKDHEVVYHDLSESERASTEVISLPMHTELTPKQQSYIAEIVLTYITEQTHAPVAG